MPKLIGKTVIVKKVNKLLSKILMLVTDINHFEGFSDLLVCNLPCKQPEDVYQDRDSLCRRLVTDDSKLFLTLQYN